MEYRRWLLLTTLHACMPAAPGRSGGRKTAAGGMPLLSDHCGTSRQSERAGTSIAMAMADTLPPSFMCPISHDVMRDPCVCRALL